MSNKIFLWIVLGVVIIGGSSWAISNQTKPATKDKSMSKTDMQKAPEEMAETNIMTKTENTSTMPSKNDMTMQDHGVYKDYSIQTLIAEQKAGQKIVLFFHATWCPECRKADTEFKTKTTDIPKGVTVLKTDYDTEKELKTKYGVTYQHTFVQIDNQGNQITKWSGENIEALIKNLK